MRVTTTLVLLFALTCPVLADEGILPPPGPAQRLPLLLRKLQETRRVLYVTAHPDDEDAGLTARLAHGDGAEVCLLTLTRGNGGQNEIGPELHGAIGALRTAELESAHRWDGAVQWFGSADDFGYSFSVEETLQTWGEERMLRELVEAIRLFRPDVILTMPPDGPGGGQHHQASAQLTERAMHVAAEETWPELGPPHATHRLFTVLWGDAEADAVCEVDLSVVDPLLGASYADVGTRSRSMHKCQGMVRIEPPLPRRKVRLVLRYDREGELRALGDPLEGIPRHPIVKDPAYRSTFGHMGGFPGVDTREQTGEIVVRPDIFGVIRSALVDDPGSIALRTLETRASEAIELGLGIRRRAVATQPFLGTLAGTSIAVASEFPDGGNTLAVLRLRVSLSGWPGWGEELPPHPRGVDRQLHTITLPAAESWSLLDGPVVKEIPTAPAAALLTGTLEIDGWKIPLVPRPVVAEWRDEVFPALRQTDLRTVPDPSIRPARRAEVAPRTGDAPAIASGEFLLSSLVGGEFTVRISADDARWTVEPAVATVAVPGGGTEVAIPWTATAPVGEVTTATVVRASALHTAFHRADPRRAPAASTHGYRRIEYPHIRTTALLEDAAVRVVRFDVAVAPRAIGYVAGVGDALPRAMRTLGYTVTELGADDLAEGDLSRFDTIVIGVRAYKVRDDLRTHHGRLMEWVRAGGTLVCQYHKFEFNSDDGTSPYVPYPGAVVGPGRVTDETAPAVVNGSGHPLLAEPNRIAAPDWRDWVQERGLYFLDVSPGAKYADILVFEDPFPFNAGPKFGSLVEAEVGEGRWIYVGLGLWRQCPAGVPGAYRLLANLLAR